MNNEQELIRRAQRGDGEAFRQLVEAYQTQVYRLALRMCGESAADDVTQEAFLAAWRALPDFRGDCRFSTWLYRLTTNAGIDWLRREKRHRSTDDVTELELPDDAPSPQEQAEQSETQSAVRRALSQPVGGAPAGTAAAVHAGAGLRRDRRGAGRQRGHGEIPHQPRQGAAARIAGSRREPFRRRLRLTIRE